MINAKQTNVHGQYMTRSGQTGTDAYSYELAQLLNRRRELHADLERIGAIIAAEMPDTAFADMPIPSDRFPDATTRSDAAAMRDWFTFGAQSLDLIEDLQDGVRRLQGMQS